jgi:hypothetical protein
MEELKKNGFSQFRIDFTVENSKTCEDVLDTFINNSDRITFKCTKGHYNRGVL